VTLTIDLGGKVAVVTGASSGIGEATATALGEAGADVVCVARHDARLTASVERVRAHGVRAHAVAVDITAEDAPARIVDEALEELGRLDVLVHSAGVFEPAPFAETTVESLDLQWTTNVRAPYLITQAALPHLRDGSSVLFVSSIAGHVGFSNSTAYCATKGAVELLVRALALELSPAGVRVNVVAPGNIKTAMNEDLRTSTDYEAVCNAQTPAGRFGEPEEIAAAVVFFASDSASYVHGASLLVDGGWTVK
jgi:NAD(P)-dependent dehydrogenase (short-subunit alcohol dehydrogenase family)